ncbi:MAG: hypothetical protein J7J07_09665 [Syntrophobacterales bacterium]|nr:hypothetical protein [Syntrophobacterales bacterium]
MKRFYCPKCKPAELAIDYVMKRHCQVGGFCFYRLEEPNGSDTCFALSILHLLGIDFRDDNTLRYLINLQSKDGSYHSIFTAYYAIKGLYFLEEKPEYDPTEYIIKNIGNYRFNIDRVPAEVISIFKRLYCLVDLCSVLKIKIAHEIKHDIVNSILSFKNEDTGFGYIRSTLLETSQALATLEWLDFPVDALNTEDFIRKCEAPSFGFTGIPNASLFYIEHIYGGLVASNIMSYKPRYTGQCADFVRYCQNNNGGFSRGTYGGISTIENTYYAVHSLSLLSD